MNGKQLRVVLNHGRYYGHILAVDSDADFAMVREGQRLSTSASASLMRTMMLRLAGGGQGGGAPDPHSPQPTELQRVPPSPVQVLDTNARTLPPTIDVALTQLPFLVGGIVVGSLCLTCLLLLCVRWIRAMRGRKLTTYCAIKTQEPTSVPGRVACRFKRWPNAPGSRPS